jgi:hypothetical protein
MSESATAETAYFHTLSARPYFFPVEAKDLRLAAINDHLLDLPPEIRFRIYQFAFTENRVVVTSSQGCYCASESTGPYRSDHRYLVKDTTGPLRQDAQHAFTSLVLWEIHCASAFNQFVNRMQYLDALTSVRHLRINVFETSRQYWHLPFDKFPHLTTVTFSPWQKGWTIDIAAPEGSPELSDSAVLERLLHMLKHTAGYQPVLDLVSSPTSRSFKILFVFPIRFKSPSENPEVCVSAWRWQLRIWRAELDAETVDRDFREVHLHQEATLD